MRQLRITSGVGRTARAFVIQQAGIIAIGASLCFAADYDASWISDTLPPAVRAGESYTVRIAYQNAGTATWDSWTRLATSNPRGSGSLFEAPSWISFDRPTDLDESSVDPGGTGTFTFDVIAPSTPGAYQQSFELVQDGVTWFNGTGDDFTWSVEVVPAGEIARAELKAISAPAYYPGVGVGFTERIANDLAELKVDMIRVEFVGEYHSDRPIFYPAYDLIVDRAAARNIDVLALVDYQSVTWADQSEWETQTFRDRFTARVQEIVTHYSTRADPIRHWEIWNEQDICVTSFCARIEPQPYAQLLIQAYDAIKAIDPQCTVVLGGLSPKGFEYTENYLADLYATTAIQNYYAQNGFYPFDVVACHPYPEVFTAPDPGLANVLNNKIKAVMNANADGDKKVWLTEMGWSSSAVSESQQATYLADSFLLLDTLTDPARPGDEPYVERYFWFRYNDFGPNDLWGLKTGDLTRQKPSYAACDALGPGYVTKPTPPIDGPAPGVFQELAPSVAELSLQPSSSDPLNGNLATRISGGFHSVNTNPDDHEPAFTDGEGLGSSTGLLMDYPGENAPAWSGFWILAGGDAVNLTEIRVFSGNTGRDGRVFHHYDVYVTDDPAPAPGSTWTLLREEIIPADFTTTNAMGTIEACLTRIVDSEGGNLTATDVTALRLDFYAVSRAGGVFNDDWDPLNGDDMDLADAAFEAPLIFEVDAYYGEWLSPGSPTGTDLAMNSTQVATDSNFSGSYTGANAIDGVVSLDSRWVSTNSTSTHWIKLDLGATYDVDGFVIRHAGAAGEPTSYNTSDFQIQSGSSYTGPWTDEIAVTGSTASVTSYVYGTPKPLRYVRLYITDAGIDDYVRLPELEVIGDDPNNTMADQTPSGSNVALSYSQVATDSNYSSSYPGDDALDGVISLSSRWVSDGSSPPHWLKLDLGSHRTVDGYIVRHASTAGEQTDYNLAAFKIQSSTSYIGPWTDETVVDNSAQDGVTNRTYATPKNLRYIRLYITDPGIDNYVRLPELEVIGQ